MYRSNFLSRVITFTVFLVLVLSGFQTALAAVPTNDDFLNATVITTLPYDDYFNNSGATLQSGEIIPSCATKGVNQTIWYAFTASQSETLTAQVDTGLALGSSVDNSLLGAVLAIYTGPSPDHLTEVSCMADLSEPLPSLSVIINFNVVAGTTYYFQVGDDYAPGEGRFHLEFPFKLDFSYLPSDPSVYDLVQFTPDITNPAGVEITGYLWAFGDGATSAIASPGHQFASDGDYTVQLTVYTADGGAVTASHVVHVSTHDIAITKLSAPNSASSERTRSITAYVWNKRRPETVQVDLYKSDPAAADGWMQVGGYSQYVPVRSGNKSTTEFSFNYTFTSADASVGKVSFKAIATIQGARDALPADNTLISSPPTKVSK